MKQSSERKRSVFFIIAMVNGPFESGLITSNGIFFSVGIRDDLKQVKRSATGNTTEPPEFFLKTLTVDHQGRLTEI